MTGLIVVKPVRQVAPQIRQHRRNRCLEQGRVPDQEATAAADVTKADETLPVLAVQNYGDLFEAPPAGLVRNIGNLIARIVAQPSTNRHQHGRKYQPVRVKHVRNRDCPSAEAHDDQ